MQRVSISTLLKAIENNELKAITPLLKDQNIIENLTVPRSFTMQNGQVLLITPAQLAVALGRTEILPKLLNQDEITLSTLKNELLTAIENKDSEAVHHFLQNHKIKKSLTEPQFFKMKNGQILFITPARLAAALGYTDILLKLLDQNDKELHSPPYDRPYLDRDGYYTPHFPLHWAAMYGRLPTVKAILARENALVDPGQLQGANITMLYSDTPLLLAVENRHHPVALELIQHGANPFISPEKLDGHFRKYFQYTYHDKTPCKGDNALQAALRLEEIDLFKDMVRLRFQYTENYRFDAKKELTKKSVGKFYFYYNENYNRQYTQEYKDSELSHVLSYIMTSKLPDTPSSGEHKSVPHHHKAELIEFVLSQRSFSNPEFGFNVLLNCLKYSQSCGGSQELSKILTEKILRIYIPLLEREKIAEEKSIFHTTIFDNLTLFGRTFSCPKTAKIEGAKALLGVIQRDRNLDNILPILEAHKTVFSQSYSRLGDLGSILHNYCTTHTSGRAPHKRNHR